MRNWMVYKLFPLTGIRKKNIEYCLTGFSEIGARRKKAHARCQTGAETLIFPAKSSGILGNQFVERAGIHQTRRKTCRQIAMSRRKAHKFGGRSNMQNSDRLASKSAAEKPWEYLKTRSSGVTASVDMNSSCHRPMGRVQVRPSEIQKV